MPVITMTEKSLDNLQALAISLIPKKPESVEAPTVELTDLQKRAARVKEMIKAHFGESGHRKAISHISAAILGVDVKEIFDEVRDGNLVSVKKGAAIFVIDNPNSHNYELGSVVFVYYDRERSLDCECVGLLKRGDEEALSLTVGNNLYIPGCRHNANSTRWATEAEIIAEIAKMKAFLTTPDGIGF